MADAFDRLVHESSNAFLRSFIAENRHELEGPTPKYIVFNPKLGTASVQGVDVYAQENDVLVSKVKESWWTGRIVLVTRDDQSGKFHVLQITRPPVLAKVEIPPSGQQFLDDLKSKETCAK